MSSDAFSTWIIDPEFTEASISVSSSDKVLVVPYDVYETGWSSVSVDTSAITVFVDGNREKTPNINKIIIPRGMKFNHPSNKDKDISNSELMHLFPNLTEVVMINEDGSVFSCNPNYEEKSIHDIMYRHEEEMRLCYNYLNPYIYKDERIASAVFYTLLLEEATDDSGRLYEASIDVIDADESKYILVIPYDVFNKGWSVEPDADIAYAHLNHPGNNFIKKVIVPRGLNSKFSKSDIRIWFPNLETIIRINDDGVIISENVNDN